MKGMKIKKTRSQAPEYLAALLDISKCVLIKHGLSNDDAEKASRELSKELCDSWGGQLIYFPYWLRMELTDRDLAIYKEFNGHNHQELSRRHKMSIQSIYRIVNSVRDEEIARRQTTLGL